MKSGKLPISSDEAQCWNIHSYDTDCEETKVQDDWQSPHNVIHNLQYEIYWADGNSSVQGLIPIRSDNFCQVKC